MTDTGKGVISRPAAGPGIFGDFASSQLEVVPGNHVVARAPGAVLVVARPATDGEGSSDAAAGDAQTELIVETLLGLAQRAFDEAPGAPGRVLARMMTTWLVGYEGSPHFGVLSFAETGLEVFLCGGVTANLIDAIGSADRLVLQGRDAGFTLDLVVAPPVTAIALIVDGSDESAAHPERRGVSSLPGGVVPGAGAILWAQAGGFGGIRAPVVLEGSANLTPGSGTPGSGTPRSTPTPEPESTMALPALTDLGAHGSQPVEPASLVKPLTELAPPALSARIDQAPDDAISQALPRRPLPIAGVGTRASKAPREEGVTVKGFRCSRKHLNDPRVAFCAVCGIRMDQLTGVLADGVRPPLGLLVLDNGATFILDYDCVLGREPEVSPGVRSRELRPIRMDDASGAMSRVHAELRLKDWDVVLTDLGSVNGTYVRVPGRQDWFRLNPGQPLVLIPGAEVMMGSRAFTFDSPHGRL